jgi:hypothetical protein
MNPKKDMDHQLKAAAASQPVLMPLLFILFVTIITQLAHLAYNSSQDFQSAGWVGDMAGASAWSWHAPVGGAFKQTAGRLEQTAQ